MARAVRVLLERLTLDVLGDQVPVTGVGLASPEDLHDVWVMNLSKGADLAPYRLVAGGAIELLERSLFALDVIPHPIDLREPALPENLQDLEPSINDVPDGVVGGLRADRRL